MYTLEMNKRYGQLAEQECCLSCGGAIDLSHPKEGAGVRKVVVEDLKTKQLNTIDCDVASKPSRQITTAVLDGTVAAIAVSRELEAA